MTDIGAFGSLSISECTSYLIETIGIAAIPAGRVFTHIPDLGIGKSPSFLARNMRLWNQPGISSVNGFHAKAKFLVSRAEKGSMLPEFLLPETTIREAGAGPAVGLGDNQGGTLLLTLGITRIIEQECLDLAIWGSIDGTDWGSKPLIAFPQKFYCGTYQMVLDLSEHSEVKYVRAQWQLNRWGKGESKPLFTVYLFVKELQPETLAVGAA
jgi:hypothetical protein